MINKLYLNLCLFLWCLYRLNCLLLKKIINKFRKLITKQNEMNDKTKAVCFSFTILIFL